MTLMILSTEAVETSPSMATKEMRKEERKMKMEKRRMKSGKTAADKAKRTDKGTLYFSLFILHLLIALLFAACSLGGDVAKVGPKLRAPKPAVYYTVTFNSNGGTSIPSQTVASGARATRPQNPSRSGYAFANWYSNAGLTTAYNFSAAVTGNITLYAKWDSISNPTQFCNGDCGYVQDGCPNACDCGCIIDNGPGTEANPIPLTVNVWADGSISSSSGPAWYSFTAASGTMYYVWWNDGYEGSGKTLDVKASAYYGGGTSIFTGVDSGWEAPRPFNASSSGTVKIKVEAYSGGNAGTFAVAYSTSNTRPGAAAVTTYTLTVDRSPAAGGTVSVNGNANPSGAATFTEGTVVSLAATANNGYTFTGWTVTGGNVASASSASTTITMNGNAVVTATFQQQSTVPLELEMVWVPGGSFQMGKELGTGGYSDVTPVHTVTLTGFWMGRYEVTQGQYREVMGPNPSSGYSYGVGDNYPVYNVSWYDALVFCNKLSMKDGLTPAYRIASHTDPDEWGSAPTSSNTAWNAVTIDSGSDGYRLPTEAEWEYAAKGGDGSPGNYTYAGSNNVGDVAWYSGNSSSRTHEVGTKAPNGLGLYDMSGNVWEWCWDWYGVYPSTAQTDPAGAASGSGRVFRGGSWNYSAENVRSAYRINDSPSSRSYGIGFRVVRP